MLTASKDKLQSYFQTSTQYKVPFFQRSYVWKEENWEKVVEMFSNVLRIDPNHQGAKRFLPQAMARMRKIGQ